MKFKTLEIYIEKDAEDEYYDERPRYRKDHQFILAMIGYSTGFSSIWIFPQSEKTLLQNRGGLAYLIPYILGAIFIIMPVYYLEIAMGQLHGDGILKILEKTHPKYKGFGIVIITCCFLTIFYIVKFIQNIYPNLEYLAILFRFIFYQVFLPFLGRSLWQNYQGFLIILFLSTMILYYSIRQGIQSYARIAIFTVFFPFIGIIIFLIVSIQLPGSTQGVWEILEPDLVELINPFVWTDATSGIFYYIGVGYGVIPILASYRKKSEQILKVSIITPIIILICGILQSMIAFCNIGYLCNQQNISFKELDLDGFNVLFNLMPQSFELQNYSLIKRSLFYLVMYLLILDTQLGLLETVSATIEDQYIGNLKIKGKKINIRLSLCGMILALSLICRDPMIWFEQIEQYSYTVGYAVFFSFEIFYFGSGFQYRKLDRYLENNEIVKLPYFFQFCLRKLTRPIIIIMLIISLIQYIQFSLNQSIIVNIIGQSVGLIPLIAVPYYYKKYRYEGTPITKNIELGLIYSK